MKVIKLIKVEPGANNNKFYNMTEQSNGTFIAEWGRVGLSPSFTSYPMGKWNSQRASKLKKGYVDMTDLHAVVQTEFEINIKDNNTKNFIKELIDQSKGVVKKHYLTDNATKAQIENAQSCLNNILLETDLNKINEHVIQLYTVIPRKMKNVKDHLLKNLNEINNFVSNEQGVLDNMSVTVKTHDVQNIELLGLEVIPITKEDEKLIKSLLGSNSNKFHSGYRILNERTDKQFKEYLKRETNKERRLFWHGSRNENWWSIMNQGLVLRPTNAVISGKMFGYGTYFADKAEKSIGYSSLRGSYWARGNQPYGILSVYDVHVGNQYHIYNREGSHGNFNKNILKSLGDYHSVYAHAGNSLLNNEFIVYDESQTNINLIVKLV
jgi:poly [ADP-ribose] polymerase 2/3/4